jgi:hypothetical protein
MEVNLDAGGNMTMQNESDVHGALHRSIVISLKKIFPEIEMTRATQQDLGVPDFLFIYNKSSLVLEAKLPTPLFETGDIVDKYNAGVRDVS